MALWSGYTLALKIMQTYQAVTGSAIIENYSADQFVFAFICNQINVKHCPNVIAIVKCELRMLFTKILN